MVEGVFDTALVENCCFCPPGETDGELYETCSYSEKSIKESRGSKQLDWELEVAMEDEDCVEEELIVVLAD